MERGNAPEVNAGSMADIAFLLLIFFLVTTTIETDTGLDRILPPESNAPPPPVAQRNILPILINGNDQILLDDEIVQLKDLKEKTITFLDNGGMREEFSDYCNYCKGERNPKSSDNPKKAIVSLMSNRETSYGMYIAVQNQLVSAYNMLRNRESQRLFKTDFVAMQEMYKDSETLKQTKYTLKKKIERIQELYPMKLSEAERK